VDSENGPQVSCHSILKDGLIDNQLIQPSEDQAKVSKWKPWCYFTKIRANLVKLKAVQKENSLFLENYNQIDLNGHNLRIYFYNGRDISSFAAQDWKAKLKKFQTEIGFGSLGLPKNSGACENRPCYNKDEGLSLDLLTKEKPTGSVSLVVWCESTEKLFGYTAPITPSYVDARKTRSAKKYTKIHMDYDARTVLRPKTWYDGMCNTVATKGEDGLPPHRKGDPTKQSFTKEDCLAECTQADALLACEYSTFVDSENGMPQVTCHSILKDGLIDNQLIPPSEDLAKVSKWKPWCYFTEIRANPVTLKAVQKGNSLFLENYKLIDLSAHNLRIYFYNGRDFPSFTVQDKDWEAKLEKFQTEIGFESLGLPKNDGACEKRPCYNKDEGLSLDRLAKEKPTGALSVVVWCATYGRLFGYTAPITLSYANAQQISGTKNMDYNIQRGVFQDGICNGISKDNRRIGSPVDMHLRSGSTENDCLEGCRKDVKAGRTVAACELSEFTGSDGFDQISCHSIPELETYKLLPYGWRSAKCVFL